VLSRALYGMDSAITSARFDVIMTFTRQEQRLPPNVKKISAFAVLHVSQYSLRAPNPTIIESRILFYRNC
jgi:hypothetical protein